MTLDMRLCGKFHLESSILFHSDEDVSQMGEEETRNNHAGWLQ